MVKGKPTPGGLTGTCPGEANSLTAGVRSPPLRGRKPRWDDPCWGNPEITRGAIFSEGRGLRVRLVRPYASQGISFPPDKLTTSRWPKGGNVGVGVVPSLRACGARPSAGLVIRARMASRGKAGNNVEGGFLGGTHSVRPRGKAGCEPKHVMIAVGGRKGRWPKGGALGLASCLPCGRAEPAPPGGSPGRMA